MKVPASLYRFRPLDDALVDRELSALEASYLFTPPFSAMNDPMEAFYETGGPTDRIVDAMLGTGKGVADLYKLLSDTVAAFALVSFAGTAEDLPMWAYYGSNFAGMCLEFDAAKLGVGDFQGEKLLPVTYARKALPPLTVADFARAEEAITERITRKRIEWSHEKEWRYVVGQVGPKHYLDDALKRVYIGPRAQPAHVDRICKLLDRRPVEILQGEIRGFDLEFRKIKPARPLSACDKVDAVALDMAEALYAEKELRSFLHAPYDQLVDIVREIAEHPNFHGFGGVDISVNDKEALYITTIFKLRSGRDVYHQRYFDRRLRLKPKSS
jgi:hypothetical protein